MFLIISFNFISSVFFKDWWPKVISYFLISFPHDVSSTSISSVTRIWFTRRDYRKYLWLEHRMMRVKYLQKNYQIVLTKIKLCKISQDNLDEIFQWHGCKNKIQEYEMLHFARFGIHPYIRILCGPLSVSLFSQQNPSTELVDESDWNVLELRLRNRKSYLCHNFSRRLQLPTSCWFEAFHYDPDERISHWRHHTDLFDRIT